MIRRAATDRNHEISETGAPSPRGVWLAVGVILLIIGVLVVVLSLTTGTADDAPAVTTAPPGSVG